MLPTYSLLCVPQGKACSFFSNLRGLRPCSDLVRPAWCSDCVSTVLLWRWYQMTSCLSPPHTWGLYSLTSSWGSQCSVQLVSVWSLHVYFWVCVTHLWVCSLHSALHPKPSARTGWAGQSPPPQCLFFSFFLFFRIWNYIYLFYY